MEKEIKIGKMYERRDGQKAFVYYFNTVTQLYSCVIVGNQDMFTVDEYGNYMSSQKSHNDLVKEINCFNGE